MQPIAAAAIAASGEAHICLIIVCQSGGIIGGHERDISWDLEKDSHLAGGGRMGSELAVR